jgi:hypothetical protein
MKKLLIVLLVLIGTDLYGQYANETSYLRRDRTKVTLQNVAYTTGQIDTCEAIQPWQFASVSIAVQSLDSASITIKYRSSIDGTNWGQVTTLDSLSTADAGYKEIALTTGTLYANYVQMILTVNAFRLGVTSATYSARWTGKLY